MNYQSTFQDLMSPLMIHSFYVNFLCFSAFPHTLDQVAVTEGLILVKAISYHPLVWISQDLSLDFTLITMPSFFKILSHYQCFSSLPIYAN